MSTVFSCKETRVSWKHGCWYPDLLISISAGILLRDKKTILLGIPTFETFWNCSPFKAWWQSFLLSRFMQLSEGGGKVQSRPWSTRVCISGRNRSRWRCCALGLQWCIACLWIGGTGRFSVSESPCRSILTGLCEAFQVGLECGDLLFQRKEILLHLVKLQAQKCFSSAGPVSGV